MRLNIFKISIRVQYTKIGVIRIAGWLNSFRTKMVCQLNFFCQLSLNHYIVELKSNIMKKAVFTLITLLIAFPAFVSAQESTDSTGFAGDHFSLEGALELLKQSSSPEDFEKKLNTEDTYVNNLDLNEDGEIDYVKVIDNAEGDVHAIVLQVDLSEEESQDIAVILIEKTGHESAVLQIVGDEDVYGEEKIVEPVQEAPESGGKGGFGSQSGNKVIIVNVWTWPGIRFIYSPAYVVYRSPWHWHYYPRWWSPWRPHPWRWHHSRVKVYHVHYRPYHTHRVVRAHTFYKPQRKSSVTVRTKTTHTRTVISKNKKGKGVSVKREKTTTTRTGTKKGDKVNTKTTKTKMEKSAKVKKGKKEATVKKSKTTKKTTRKKR